jgi:hypothetical protein
MADYVLKVLSPEQADVLYVRKEDYETDQDQGLTYIGPTQPTEDGPYLWVDTSIAGKFTFWIEDGN